MRRTRPCQTCCFRCWISSASRRIIMATAPASWKFEHVEVRARVDENRRKGRRHLNRDEVQVAKLTAATKSDLEYPRQPTIARRQAAFQSPRRPVYPEGSEWRQATTEF